MTTNPIETSPPKRRRWLFTLGWIALALVALLVVGYFVATSNAFFQGVILPRVGRSIDATVTVSQASISPFSQVILRDLKVQPRGEEPVLLAKEVRVRYHLMAMLRGQINLDEAVIDSPTIRFLRKANGTSNWDPILKTVSQETPGQPPPPAPPPSAPPRVDLKKLAVSHAVFNFAQVEPNGDTFRADIPDLNLELTGVKNGQTAKFTLAANLEINATSQTNVSKVSATLKSDLSTDLAADLMPDRVEGQTEFVVPTATGTFADAAGLKSTLTAKLSATEIQQLALQFAKGTAALGSLTVSGPLDLRKQEGKLHLEVNGIGNEVLSLVGGPYGLSFGETKLAAKCDLELKNQAQLIAAVGSLTGTALSLTRGSLTSPKVDFQLDYNLAADLPATNATLRQLTFNATQNGSPLLRAALTREMRIDWSKAGDAVPDSTLEVALTQLDLAQWQALAGPEVKGGVLNGKLGLGVQKAGKLVTFDLTSQLAGLSAEFQTNRLSGLNATLATRGQVADFSQVDLADLSVQTTLAGQPLMSVKGVGKYNTLTSEANLQTELEASLVQALALQGTPDPQLASGTLKFTGRVAQRNTTPGQSNNPALAQDIVGDLVLANLAARGAAGKAPQKPLDARLKLDASMLNQRLDLRQVQFGLTPTERAQNQMQLAGQVDMSRSNAITGNLKLVAEALDLTAYYDLYESQQAAVTNTPPPPPGSTPAPPPPPETEPPAVELPLSQFVASVEIARLYLREVAISNVQATAKIDGGKVKLDPMQLTLNGAAASSKMDFNLGVPGYQYAIDLQAREVPVAPLVNSFQPESKGQMGGTLTLVAQINGAGITGPSLQKNLAGQFDFATTNLNLKLSDVQNRMLKSVLNVIVTLPAIIRNPSSAISGFSTIAKGFMGSAESPSTTTGGWEDELSKTIIDSMLFRGQAGKGRIDIQRAFVQSPLFQVETRGPVTLAPILTNSAIDFPVSLTLRRSLAEAIKQVPPETPTNAPYVKLPDFLTLQGTVGKPDKKYDKVALAMMGTKLVGSFLGDKNQGTVDQVTGGLNALKNMLPGKDSTNSAATNKPSLQGLIDGFMAPRTAPNTNAPPTTNAPPKRGLLDGLLPPPAAPATNQPPSTNAPPKQKGLFDLLK